MDKFHIGEVVIIIADRDGWPTTLEGTVTKGLHESGRGPCYIVDVQGFPNNEGWYMMEEDMRKRPPPPEASWKTLERITGGWNPTKVKEELSA